MFIEKLKKADFEKFAESLHCSLDEVSPSTNNTVYVKLSTGVMGPNPEFWLSDFDCTANSYFYYAEEGVKKRLRKLLTAKYGDKYKFALAKYLEGKAKYLKSGINDL